MTDNHDANTGNAASQLILYEGSALERISASAIVLASQVKQSRYHLAGDVIVGAYGVAGFVIVDNKPENRYVSYEDGNLIGINYDDASQHYIDGEVAKDAVRLSHFIGTSKGFKMARYFVLTPKVNEFFETDKFLGEPMVDKCCREGTLPDEFDEVKVSLRFALCSDTKREFYELLNAVSPFGPIAEISDSSERLLYEFGHQLYYSFHQWHHYKPVIEAGEESVVRAIRNFDNFLARFDSNNRLERKEMNAEKAIPYKSVLKLPE